jgi:hypothetical protein
MKKLSKKLNAEYSRQQEEFEKARKVEKEGIDALLKEAEKERINSEALKGLSRPIDPKRIATRRPRATSTAPLKLNLPQSVREDNSQTIPSRVEHGNATKPVPPHSKAERDAQAAIANGALNTSSADRRSKR